MKFDAVEMKLASLTVLLIHLGCIIVDTVKMLE
jgi:hypothetical protein